MMQKDLIESNVDIDDGPGKLVAPSGHVNVLDFMYENGFTPPDNFGTGAVDCRRLDVLLWSKEHNIGWNGLLGLQATLNDDLALSQWLRENGCPRDERFIIFEYMGEV